MQKLQAVRYADNVMRLSRLCLLIVFAGGLGILYTPAMAQNADCWNTWEGCPESGYDPTATIPPPPLPDCYWSGFGCPPNNGGCPVGWTICGQTAVGIQIVGETGIPSANCVSNTYGNDCGCKAVTCQNNAYPFITYPQASSCNSIPRCTVTQIEIWE